MIQNTHKKDKIIKFPVDDPIYQIHEYDINVKCNEIYLFGRESGFATNLGEIEDPGVEYGLANRFIRNIDILARNTDEPILVRMKIKGGDWEEGMAIYDAIKACPNPVIILNYTWARSMSSLIFCAATKRVMMPHSKFMYHDGKTGKDGTHKQFMTFVAQEKASKKIMMDIYVDILWREKKTKYKSKSDIRRMLQREIDKKEDVFYTAQEAVDIGFADEIFGQKGIYNWKKLLETTDEQRSR